ncbi:MAG TPA: M3 family oligoendopeptidase [Acidimicrobiales bacterium]|jgi:oligoendopeptidase F|nr:M3 family oligoendopeptidase [Acidimicrobiales bacterium]
MAVTDLPRWDVTDLFPAIGSREYAAAREALGAGITRLTALYDEHDVRGGDDKKVDDDTVTAFDTVVEATNELMEEVRLLSGFVSSYVSTDSMNDEASGEMSELQAELAQLQRLRSRFDAWIGSLGADELAARSQVAADHAYPLQRSEERATHQMTEAEEGLLADLSLTGSTAWQRLWGTFTSQLSVTVDAPNHADLDQPISMSQARNLAYHADASVRRAAYEAELATWEANAVPIVAALNAIKGETSIVNRRRGWGDDLEPALASNGVDRQTLDAMNAAVKASLPSFRRYLKAKARLLGHAHGAGLPFYDLFAPVGSAAPRDWGAATTDVQRAFSSYSPALGDLVERATSEKWIDAEPRRGKRDGAFCMGIKDDRSLVLMNYDGSFRSVQTLAHELGHAYHNTTLAQRTPLQRQLPMALAETASIFCETIMVEQGLAAATGDDRLSVVEGDLQAACQVVVDIHSRFLFESSFFEARQRRTLSAGETCELMLAAQEASYGDGLDASLRHPYMWAAKPHYYTSTFYNWPYTFGLLFGLGLYARYQDDPERFRGSYDDLLSSCGLGSARELAGRFGIDVADEAFWASSLGVIERRIDEFEQLASAG